MMYVTHLIFFVMGLGIAGLQDNPVPVQGSGHRINPEQIQQGQPVSNVPPVTIYEAAMLLGLDGQVMTGGQPQSPDQPQPQIDTTGEPIIEMWHCRCHPGVMHILITRPREGESDEDFAARADRRFSAAWARHPGY